MTFSWEEQSTRARRAAVAVDPSSSSSLQLAGGRAVAVARLVSLAPPGARLTPTSATALLSTHGWSLRAALEAVARELAFTDSTALYPVPLQTRGVRMRNMVNAGNSCYLDAVISALFATWDAWDGTLASNVAPAIQNSTGSMVLSPSRVNDGRGLFPCSRISSQYQGYVNSYGIRNGVSRQVQQKQQAIQHLRATVREAVNRLRRGEGVSAAAVEAIRSALRAAGFQTRRGQEDAAELFVFLVDTLGAPFLPLGETLLHPLPLSASDDERMATERVLWLSLPCADDMSLKKTTSQFKNLLNDYFFGNRLEGIRRNSTVVNAWKARRILPWYTPMRETGEVAAINDETSFRALPVPFALKRYSANGHKSRVHVDLPPRIDFSDFVDGVSAGSFSLVLRSVVCHLGDSLDSGHYVSYTYDAFGSPFPIWRRWNDLTPGYVEEFTDDQLSLSAREEQCRDAYIVFYELVPGDGLTDPRDSFFHVRDVDPLALAEDDRTFALALQRIELDEFTAAGNQCHMQ